MLDLMRAQQIRESDDFFGRRDRERDQQRSYHRPSATSRPAGRTFTPDIEPPDTGHRSDDRHSTTAPVETATFKADSAVAEASCSTTKTDAVAPHARFFISRSKSSTAIKFDPPVSGRYILVKLWAQCPNANIDIQAILAHGYGGPRFFPAIEMR